MAKKGLIWANPVNSRNPTRIPQILSEIEQYWKRFPDMRLGQLIVVLAHNHDPFYLEDTEMLTRLQQLNEDT